MNRIYCMVTFLLMIPSISLASELTKDVQNLLNFLGYNSGEADGIWGSKTKFAIEDFYKNRGSNFDGLLDQNELIDLKSEVTSVTAPSIRFNSGIPDQNSDYKIHFSYVVPADAEDMKRDITVELQRLVESSNEVFFKAT